MTTADNNNLNTINKGTTISISLGIAILGGVIVLLGGALDFKGQVSSMAVQIEESREDTRTLKQQVTDLSKLLRELDRRMMKIEAEKKNH